MSEPIPRELFKTAHNRFHGRFDTHAEVAKHSRWTREELEGVQIEDEELYYDELEQLINAEVLAVLNELEKKKETALYADFADGSVEDYTAIPLSAITQLKQRYGGKEQENER